MTRDNTPPPHRHGYSIASSDVESSPSIFDNTPHHDTDCESCSSRGSGVFDGSVYPPPESVLPRRRKRRKRRSAGRHSCGSEADAEDSGEIQHAPREWSAPHDLSESEADARSGSECDAGIPEESDDGEADADNSGVGAFERAVQEAASNSQEPRVQDTEGCWGCQYGATMHAGQVSDDKMRTLISLIRDNHGRMDNVELARIVAKHHESHIRQPIVSAGGSCGRWPAHMVLRHLQHHTLDPGVVLAENIRTLRAISRQLRKRTLETDLDTGEQRVDGRNVDLLLKTVRGLSELYSKSTDGMLFGSYTPAQGPVRAGDYIMVNKSQQ